MKKALIILLYLSCSQLLFSQNAVSDTTYHDGYVKKSKSDATFYSVTNIVGKMKVVRTFDIKDNLISRQQYILNPVVSQRSYNEWLLHGPSFLWYKKDVLHQEVNYLYGQKQGIFKDFYPSGALLKQDSFSAGTLCSSYFYFENVQTTLVFEQGIKQVRPVNKAYAETALITHFAPIELWVLNKPHDVYVCFMVDKKGNPRDFHLINCDDPKAYNKMLQLVESLPKLSPAFKKGVPIETMYLVPIYTSSPFPPRKSQGRTPFNSNDNFFQNERTHQPTLLNEHRALNIVRH